MGSAPLTGVRAMAMAPSFVTAGWFAAGPGLLRKAGHVLLDGRAADEPMLRLLVARDAFDLAEPAVGAALRAFLIRASAILPVSEELV
jgi:amidase